jgi:hypothetical protein
MRRCLRLRHCASSPVLEYPLRVQIALTPVDRCSECFNSILRASCVASFSNRKSRQSSSLWSPGAQNLFSIAPIQTPPRNDRKIGIFGDRHSGLSWAAFANNPESNWRIYQTVHPFWDQSGTESQCRPSATWSLAHPAPRSLLQTHASFSFHWLRQVGPEIKQWLSSAFHLDCQFSKLALPPSERG